MADVVISECKKFIKFKQTTVPDDFHKHLNYLYSFNKFIFANVKRPFKLYEDCVSMIITAHIYPSSNDLGLSSQIFQDLLR